MDAKLECEVDVDMMLEKSGIVSMDDTKGGSISRRRSLDPNESSPQATILMHLVTLQKSLWYAAPIRFRTTRSKKEWSGVN